MSNPMTLSDWETALKKFDQPYVKQLEAGRDSHTGLTFGPVHGALIHHTGDNAADSADSRVISQGRSDLPGPLAHAGCRDDGVIELKTLGRANHAGSGDKDVYNSVLNESYKSYPPKPNLDSMDGNDPFYGLEIYWSGTGKPTQRQYNAAVNWAAAICWHHGWSVKSIIGHKEWTRRKIDPGFDMAQFRKDVQGRLDSVRHPKPVKPTRIQRFLKGGPKWNVKLLDAAVKNGRNGSVKDIRDKFDSVMHHLPKDKTGRVAAVNATYKKNRVIRMTALDDAVSKGHRTGKVKSCRDQLKALIAELRKEVGK